MKYFSYIFSILVIVGLSSSCELDPVNDPNNPSLGGVLTGADKAELQSLVSGLEARHRAYLDNATEMFGTFGREVLPYFGSDPRFQTDWLGTNITETYTDFFASAGTYVTPYLAVKQANVLIQAAQNSETLTSEETNAYTGLAKTIKAYQLLWPWLQQWDNGIRIDVEDPLNPGPTLSRADALDAMRAILDEGYQELQNAGSTLPYELTTGWAGFDSPEGLQLVNRAIAARLALYDEDWQGTLDALDESFMDLNVDAASQDLMWMGPAHVYGESPDINNPLFYPYDQATSTILIVHPAMVEDLLPGDQRGEKWIKREDNPVENSGIRLANGDLIPGEYQDNRWASNTAPIPFIRNEELILIYAEANARLDNTSEAVRAINIVRNTWGLDDYSGSTSEEDLIDEILFQRRFSLWAENGHRWIDLRRTGRLDADYVDLRAQGNLFTQVARRTSEINWDER